MENHEKIGKSSSCRSGVAFEIKSHADPSVIPAPVINYPHAGNSSSRRSWLSSSELYLRSMSRNSSHFCDNNDDEDDGDDEILAYVEEGHEHEGVVKKPPSSRLSVILLDQGLFTVYKRLFVVCIALNITGLVLAATGKFQYARNRAALFSIANIFASVLCRSEAFLRVVFWLAVNVLRWSWVPLRLKTMTTSSLQSLGGIHSSCALPLFRHLHHNVFERTHRFAGWAALALLWAFIILTISYDPNTKSYTNDLKLRLIRRQEFWFTVGITVLIIIPWLTVRRVRVRVSSPSGHASIIKFDGGVKAGILGRISPSPYSEWHAFGIVSDNKNEHMMLAGAVGDFTKSLVSDPPSYLWVRQVHFAGLPYLTNMYNRVLLVATGSGICVFLSFLLQPCKAEVCLLWVTKGVEQNFGIEIKEWMSGHPTEKVIVHDTAVLGRPNVKQMSVDTAKNFGAEVVIVTSNPEGSRDVVDACKAAGIAAFGPIWDS
ncbi:hypothetical protein BUALT_Bualt03G0047800 [Buddleja alternifolia]|uniref:Adenylate-forming reductase n=1 Tax=Buddleja alternifolia TaxID=168488 RepID=A0AAV6XZA0_9LAMI|nr:hypothetical protein BUALT_Bualt03G0047800 [Buddleja alternifolia]